MSEVDSLDTGRLATYLEANVAGFRGPLTAEKFANGQSNPTFRLRAASGDYVLRRQPPGVLLKSAHAVDREYRVIGALAGTGVPVPRVFHLCRDPDVVGSMFYVMEFCRGRVLQDSSIPGVDPVERGVMYDEMNRVLVALHGVDLVATGLSDYGRPGNYFERQISRWTKQYRASEIRRIQPMEYVMEWLGEHTPEDDGQVSLVHGDFRLGNLMWRPDQPRILAVLDWELSTLGHPLADLAYQCMQLRRPYHDPNENLRGLGGLDRGELGIPTEKEYVASYCERRGLSHIEHWDFYLVFSFFRLAAIVQGIAKRAEVGNASSSDASWAIRTVEPLAKMGMHIARDGA